MRILLILLSYSFLYSSCDELCSSSVCEQINSIQNQIEGHGYGFSPSCSGSQEEWSSFRVFDVATPIWHVQGYYDLDDQGDQCGLHFEETLPIQCDYSQCEDGPFELTDNDCNSGDPPTSNQIAFFNNEICKWDCKDNCSSGYEDPRPTCPASTSELQGAALSAFNACEAQGQEFFYSCVEELDPSNPPNSDCGKIDVSYNCGNSSSSNGSSSSLSSATSSAISSSDNYSSPDNSSPEPNSSASNGGSSLDLSGLAQEETLQDLKNELELFRLENSTNLQNINNTNLQGFENLQQALSGGQNSSPTSSQGSSSNSPPTSSAVQSSSSFDGNCEGVPITMANLFDDCDEEFLVSSSSVDYGLSVNSTEEPDFGQIEGQVVTSTVGTTLKNSLEISVSNSCPSLAYNPCEHFGGTCLIDICDTKWNVSGYHVLEIMGFLIQMIGVLIWWRIVIRGFD